MSWDDLTNIISNHDYRGLGWAQLKWMWTTTLMARYLPLMWMSFGLDYVTWGMNPSGYHLSNVLLHTANAVLFYFVALRILRIAVPPVSSETREKIPWAALFAALIFAVHPLRVESVAWVTERRDVLSGLFYLAAMLAYLRAFHEAPGRAMRRKFYWICLALFALALLSKDITLTLPLVLLVLDVYPLRRLGGMHGWFPRSARLVWLEKIPFFALSIACGFLTLHLTNQQGLNAPLAEQSWFERIAMAVYSLSFYLWKTVAPVNLSPFYPTTPHKLDPAAAPLEISIFLVLSIAAASILLRKKFPALMAIWVAYGVTLAPVLGLFFKGLHITADRYSYLACLGWALLAGTALLWAMASTKSRSGKTLVAVVAALVVFSLADLSWKQVQVWHDSDTLWTHAVSVEPSGLALASLGSVLMQRGDNLWAIEYFRKAISVEPGYWVAHFDLASCLGNLGRWDEAAHEYQIVLTLKYVGQALADVQNALGHALLEQNKLEESVEHFREALKLRPTFAKARENLETTLKEMNRKMQAP